MLEIAERAVVDHDDNVRLPEPEAFHRGSQGVRRPAVAP